MPAGASHARRSRRGAGLSRAAAAGRDKGLICLSIVGGTAGDVRPLVALALAERARGFEILLLGDAAFEATALRAGIRPSEWFTWSEVSQNFLQRTAAGQRRLWGKRRRYRDRWMARAVAEHRRNRMQAFWHRVGGPNNPRIVAAVGSYTAWGMLWGFGPQCPRVVAGTMPYQPSARFTLDPPDRSLGERARAWLRARTAAAKRYQRLFCEEMFHLVTVSPTLFPRPDDWLPNMQVAGYTALEDDYRDWLPPPALAEFLDSGPPPAYVGFGSYPFLFGRRGEDLAAAIVQGCRRRGMRCVIQSQDLPASFGRNDVYVLNAGVPHAWLFPRCSVIVHHGGYGTTHAALVARRPMIAYPYQTDQFLWAARTGAIGVSPGFTARLRDLSAARLERDLDIALTPECGSNAERWGTAVCHDDGGGATQIAALESIIEHSRRGLRPLDWRMPATG